MSAPAWLFQRGVLWAIDLGPVAAPRVEAHIPVRFAEAGRDDLSSLAQAMGLSDASEARRRLDSGRRCFAGWAGSTIATYGWVSIGDEDVGELERTYRMAAGDAYIWDCATLPNWRGQGLYSALLATINAILGGEGVRRAWIGTNVENAASLKAFARSGFHRVVEVVYARFMRLSMLWLIAQRGTPPGMFQHARQMLVAPHERLLGVVAFGIRPHAPVLAKPAPAGKTSH
jgi:GNAT superfamily N-acetyltransferase